MKKKKRAANFTHEEKSVLLESVLNEKEVLFGFNDLPQKNIAWKRVLEAVNNVSHVERTMHDIRRKLKDLKACTRRKYFDFRGGGRKTEEASLEEQKILSLLGSESSLGEIKKEKSVSEGSITKDSSKDQEPLDVSASTEPNKQSTVEADQNKQIHEQGQVSKSAIETRPERVDDNQKEPNAQPPLKKIKLILRHPEEANTSCADRLSQIRHTPIKIENFDAWDKAKPQSENDEAQDLDFSGKKLVEISDTLKKLLEVMKEISHHLKTPSWLGQNQAIANGGVIINGSQQLQISEQVRRNLRLIINKAHQQSEPKQQS